MIEPEWSRKGASKEIVQEWDRFLGALHVHEGNHLKIFSAAYKKVGEVGQRERVEEILDLAQRCSDEYDIKTNRGALEGVRLGSKAIPQDFTGLVHTLIRRMDELS